MLFQGLELCHVKMAWLRQKVRILFKISWANFFPDTRYIRLHIYLNIGLCGASWYFPMSLWAIDPINPQETFSSEGDIVLFVNAFYHHYSIEIQQLAFLSRNEWRTRWWRLISLQLIVFDMRSLSPSHWRGLMIPPPPSSFFMNS